MNKEYLKLVKHVFDNGVGVTSRNGNTLSIPHASFTLDFSKDDPLLSLRKMSPKGIEGEFKTFIDSSVPLTNVLNFKANGCNYWGEWADSEGKLNLDYYNMLHPQLEDVINNMKSNPESRRHVIELWNHDHVESGELSLPSCWHGMTFSIIDNKLHMTWVQRSVDVMIGLPSDVYLAYLFMNYISKLTNTEVATCMFALSNVHIYATHLEGVQDMLDGKQDTKFKIVA